MGINATKLPKLSLDERETLLEFPDNRLLIDLCGEFDRNLAQVEHNLDVQIIRRGNQLALIGGSAERDGAGQVLKALYAKLEAGRSIDAGEIDGEIKLGHGMDANAAVDGAPIADVAQSRTEILTRKKTIGPRSPAQEGYVRSLYEKEMVFGIGPAGTGKTYLAVAVAVNMFIDGHVDKIILSRPAVEAGERLGFLPGDMKEKVDPYMQPLYDALSDFLPGKQLAKLIEEKRIEIAPLAFMRGRTLSNAFVVLDEAQNSTTMQMKMFLTRLGRGSRMAITGDRSQVDLPKGTASGLADAERLLADINKIAFNYFTARDVVRHPLVSKIIDAYDSDA